MTTTKERFDRALQLQRLKHLQSLKLARKIYSNQWLLEPGWQDALKAMNECAIMVTGLPASGKTTLGCRIAAELSWPYLDKDDFLEAMFDSQGLGDEQWRRRLSIEADEQFEIRALEQSNTVLVSHWRPRGRTDTGTPVDWVNRHFQNTIEVYCECDPELATRRFVSRTRHPGHLDETKSEEAILSWMHAFG